MPIKGLLELAGYSEDDFIVDAVTGEASEDSYLDDEDMMQLEIYYNSCNDILHDLVKGSYTINSCDGLADYPYCMVEVTGDVIGFTEEHRLYGFHFEKVTGNFDCSGGGLTSLHTNTNCGEGQGFWCLIDTLHGDLIANNNNFRNLNGMCEVRGNVYVKGCSNLKAVKENYEGFYASSSKVPMERIFADGEIDEKGYINTEFKYKGEVDVDGIKRGEIIQEAVFA